MNTCDHYNYVKTNAYVESLKKRVCNLTMCLGTLRLMWRLGFTTAVCECWNVSNKYTQGNAGDLKQHGPDSQ